MELCIAGRESQQRRQKNIIVIRLEIDQVMKLQKHNNSTVIDTVGPDH